MSAPENPFVYPTVEHQVGGIRLRDWFAGQAMYVTGASVSAGIAAGHKVQWSNESIARDAYALADAMLKAREQQS